MSIDELLNTYFNTRNDALNAAYGRDYLSVPIHQPPPIRPIEQNAIIKIRPSYVVKIATLRRFETEDGIKWRFCL